MFNFTNPQENANQNHGEILLHVHWDGSYKSEKLEKKKETGTNKC